jgi:hypothetical protein
LDGAFGKLARFSDPPQPMSTKSREVIWGGLSSAEVDARLEEMGALDLVYPELMGSGQ